MIRKSNQELKELITKFFALDPTPEQIELFAVNDVLPHDKRKDCGHHDRPHNQ